MKKLRLAAALQAAFAALAAAALPAHAEHDHVLRPYAEVGLSFHDNLLAFPDAAAAQAATGSTARSDTVRKIEGGLDLDKEIGRQQLTGRFAVSRNTFDRYKTLDHDDREATLNWNWRLGDTLAGELGDSYLKKLELFDTFHTPELNSFTVRRRHADIGWQWQARWRLFAKTARDVYRYDVAGQQMKDRDLDESSAGLEYTAGSGSRLVVQGIRGDSTYARTDLPTLLPRGQDYRQREVRATLEWQASAKTRLQLTGGRIERRHASANARDFDGINRRASAIWKATTKTELSVNAWRESVGADERIDTSHVDTRGIGLGMKWFYSVKTNLAAGISREKNRIIPLVAGTPEFEEVFRGGTLALSYLPTPHVTIVGTLFGGTLDSEVPQASYRRNALLLTARYQY